jgi:Spy/CpxP family protein refolding chaperone
MRFHGVLLMLSTSLLLAQAPPPARGPQPGAQAAPARAELKSFLGLTDQQFTQLVQLRRDEQEALRPIREQMAVKTEALRDALAAGTPDAAAVGQLTLDVRALRQQVRQINEDYHSRAIGLLDDAQKTKLQTLQRLMRLQPAVNAATALNLLLPPQQRMGPGQRGGPGRGAGAPGMMMRRQFGMRGGGAE